MTASDGFDSFRTRYDSGQSQIVREWVPADLHTPVSAYMKLCTGKANNFLLESVEGGAVLGRYSSIGFDPDFTWTPPAANALVSLREAVRASRIDHIEDDLPPMATSGLFGYMGYGMIRMVENIPDTNPDEIGIPDSVMIRPTMMVIFDNVRQMACIATPVRPSKNITAQKAYDAAQKRIAAVRKTLDKPAPKLKAVKSTPGTPVPNMTHNEFCVMVEKAKEYIRAGEIFQVLPSQRFTVPFSQPPFALYRALRRLNPSPFLFFFNFGGYAIVGSSPEILVRVRKGTVTIRPLAGTRRRGKDAAEDKLLAAELLADPKERAEHLMLIDLGRNDVGRIAATGTVKLTDSYTIEYYSHVMHIVSNVEGKLRDDLDALDALFSGFPAGTVSGAPKIRAMEIIDELENTRRSFYGGCIGYLDGNGDIDTCIALRTGLIKDEKLYVQSGVGVVADSDPAAEYQESCDKARALIRAAELASS